jgi:putative endonuclease
VRPGLDRRALGSRSEDIAAHFLASQGFALVERNFRRRLGELDLIARHGDVLVIAEVRTRSSNAYGGAAASVDGLKRRRIVRAAQLLLQRRKDLAELRVRFDVLVVHEPMGAAPRVEWIQHAFEA